MKTPKITSIRKYVSALKGMKKKYVTCELLSKKVGIYPEIIAEDLAYFDPIVKLDYQYNLMDLVNKLDEFIIEIHEENSNNIDMPKTFVTKRKLDKYESIGDFVYQKMTIGGLLDKNIVLTDTELRALKRLINDEQLSRKLKKAKK